MARQAATDAPAHHGRAHDEFPVMNKRQQIGEGYRVRRRNSTIEGTVIAVTGHRARVQWDEMTTGFRRGGSKGITTEINTANLITVGFVDAEDWNYLCARRREPNTSAEDNSDTIPF